MWLKVMKLQWVWWSNSRQRWWNVNEDDRPFWTLMMVMMMTIKKDDKDDNEDDNEWWWEWSMPTAPGWSQLGRLLSSLHLKFITPNLPSFTNTRSAKMMMMIMVMMMMQIIMMMMMKTVLPSKDSAALHCEWTQEAERPLRPLANARGIKKMMRMMMIIITLLCDLESFFQAFFWWQSVGCDNGL